jgi:alpha-glucuronidase
MKKTFLFFHLFFFTAIAFAEDGYRLWLRYDKIDDATLLQRYRNQINSIYFDVYSDEPSPTFEIAKKELITGLQGLLDKKINEGKDFSSYQLIINKKRTEIVQTAIDFSSENLGSEVERRHKQRNSNLC